MPDVSTHKYVLWITTFVLNFDYMLSAIWAFFNADSLCFLIIKHDKGAELPVSCVPIEEGLFEVGPVCCNVHVEDSFV